MIACPNIATVASTPKHDSDGFLQLLPAIMRIARFAFRFQRGDRRRELIQETIANSFVTFKRLMVSGKADRAFASPIAWFAVRQVLDGRRVGCRLRVDEVLSEYAQKRNGFAVRSLEGDDRSDERWQAMAVESRESSPADTAAFRIDFASWLRKLRPRWREIALDLAGGNAAVSTAKRFGVSKARIAQLRRALETNWNEYQQLPAA